MLLTHLAVAATCNQTLHLRKVSARQLPTACSILPSPSILELLHHRALGAEDDGAVSYGRFRNFLVLLPPERLTGMDAETAWFESATIIPLGAIRAACRVLDPQHLSRAVYP